MLGHYYAWCTPENVANLTLTQVSVYIHGIKHVEYKRNFHIAALTASLLNAQGGKDTSGKKRPRSQVFVTEDFLADYANPYHTNVTASAAVDILKFSKHESFPLWAASLLPPEHELRRVANSS